MFNHPKAKHIYCGVDVHRKTHTACFMNCFFEKLGEITFPNTPSSFNILLEESKKYCPQGMTVIYGLEDSGMAGRSLAVFLIDMKCSVKTVNSKYTNAERKALPIYEKTDSFDALCCARVLLSRLESLPNANPIDNYWTLKMLVGTRNSIVKSNVALKNQIQAYIMHHYPSYKKFFSVFDCPTALEFWENYPSPSHLKGISVDELAKFLRLPSDDFFGTKKAQFILETVKADGDTSTEHQQTRDFIISESVKEMKHKAKEISKIEREMKKIMQGMSYHLESMIGIELVSACSFVAEIGDINRFSSSAQLAKYSGICPITYASGDKEKKFKNRQGNRRLYHQFHSLAARNINPGRNKNKPVNDIFYAYYKKKLSEGKTDHQALIAVMRRLVNIVYGLMKNGSKYIHPNSSARRLKMI